MIKKFWVYKKSAVIGMELIIFLMYTVYSLMAYSENEITFSLDDMQLQDVMYNYERGGYLDISASDKKAVVTPEFQLKKGIYSIEVSYAEHGIAKAGLIYDGIKNGKELVDGDEFTVNPEENGFSYRVRVRNNSAMRFKLRLTGDAADNDYVQLLQVQVVSSKLTYLYSLFCLAIIFLALDLILEGYFKYYTAWSPEQKVVFIILAFMAFFMGLPLYRNGLSEPENMDLKFHLQRIEGVYKGLLSGQFPVKIQPEWLDGYGYASSVFYGDIFMYVPAILRMVGFTLQDAYKCYSEIINIAVVFISFYSFKKITKNDIAAMMGSILYAGSTANLSLLYTTTMVGGYSAIAFYPLVIAGFYLAFTEDVSSKGYKQIWILLTFGFTGLVMTHIISCLIVGAYSVLCCLLLIKKVFRKNTIIEFIKAVCATAFLNLWFLVPLVNYMLSEKIRINDSLKKEINKSHFLALGDFTEKGDGRSLYNLFLHSEYHIDYVILIILLLYIFTLPIQKKNEITRYSRALLGCTFFSFWICTDLFPVVQVAKIHTVFLKFFTTIQYQYRFFNIAIALAACLGTLFFAMGVLKERYTYIVIGLLCSFTLYQDFQYFKTVNTESVYLDYIDLEIRQGNFEMGKAEYLPTVTDMGNLVKDIEYGEELQINDVQRNYLTFDISITNLTGQEHDILIPVLYYSGYQTFDIQSKEKLKTSIGDNGRVCVTIPANYDGTFHMAFCEPWYWRGAEIISVIVLFFFIYYLIQLSHRQNNYQYSDLGNEKKNV